MPCVWNVFGCEEAPLAYEGDIILTQGEQVIPSFRYEYRYDESRQVVLGIDGWSSIWDAYYSVGYGLSNTRATVKPLEFNSTFEFNQYRRLKALRNLPLDMLWINAHA